MTNNQGINFFFFLRIASFFSLFTQFPLAQSAGLIITDNSGVIIIIYIRLRISQSRAKFPWVSPSTYKITRVINEDSWHKRVFTTNQILRARVAFSLLSLHSHTLKFLWLSPCRELLFIIIFSQPVFPRYTFTHHARLSLAFNDYYLF